MEKKEKNLTISYALIQGFFWMNFAGVLGFASVYLLDMGMTNTQIGLLIAAAGTISAVLQPVIASYADSTASPSLKKIVLVLCAGALGMALLLLVTSGYSLLLTGLFYGGSITVLQILTPLINSLGMESLNQGKSLNFGVSRGMGSVAYAIAAYVLGGVAASLGAVSIPVAIILIFGALMISLLFFPFQKSKTEGAKDGPKSSGSFPAFVKRYKRFCIALCGCVCLYISHILINSFTFQIVERKGGGSQEMGFAMALASILELPIMFLFGAMIKKVRADIWFRISGIFFMLKTLGTLLAPNMLVFYFVQVFQMFGWALITVSSVYYVNSVMEEQDAIKGQAYMTMTYTLGSVLGALIGGALIDHAGVDVMLIFATAAAFLGMVIVLAAGGSLASGKTVTAAGRGGKAV